MIDGAQFYEIVGEDCCNIMHLGTVDEFYDSIKKLTVGMKKPRLIITNKKLYVFDSSMEDYSKFTLDIYFDRFDDKNQ